MPNGRDTPPLNTQRTLGLPVSISGFTESTGCRILFVTVSPARLTHSLISLKHNHGVSVEPWDGKIKGPMVGLPLNLRSGGGVGLGYGNPRHDNTYRSCGYRALWGELDGARSEHEETLGHVQNVEDNPALLPEQIDHNIGGGVGRERTLDVRQQDLDQSTAVEMRTNLCIGFRNIGTDPDGSALVNIQ